MKTTDHNSSYKTKHDLVREISHKLNSHYTVITYTIYILGKESSRYEEEGEMQEMLSRNLDIIHLTLDSILVQENTQIIRELEGEITKLTGLLHSIQNEVLKRLDCHTRQRINQIVEITTAINSKVVGSNWGLPSQTP